MVEMVEMVEMVQMRGAHQPFLTFQVGSLLESSNSQGRPGKSCPGSSILFWEHFKTKTQHFCLNLYVYLTTVGIEI